MKTFREILEGVIASPMKVVTVDTPVEFIHFDKMKDNWRLTISKSLLKEEDK